MAARCAPVLIVLLGLPLARAGGETEIDFDYLMKQEARTLIMAFYLILFLYPVARWLVHRYTAKIASLSQEYLDSLSARARARVRRSRDTSHAPAPPRSSRKPRAASSRPPRPRSPAQKEARASRSAALLTQRRRARRVYVLCPFPS